MAKVTIRRPGADADDDRQGIRQELMIVAAVAAIVNVIAFSASQLWVCPDSGYYIALAGGLAERFDFGNELFLIRPPGYPLFLAGIFFVFGSWSPEAILILQHVMLAGIAVLTALTAWHLTRRRSITLVSGLFSAGSLQLLAFANVVLAVVPYTLALTLSIYFLIRYHRTGEKRSLAFASLAAGASYWMQPAGLSLVAICLLAALMRTWMRAQDQETVGTRVHLRRTRRTGRRSTSIIEKSRISGGASRWQAVTMELGLAVLPASIVVSPLMLLNRLEHGAPLTGVSGSLALYDRLAVTEGFVASTSRALSDIRVVVKEATDRGELPANADYRDWGSVWQAYESVRGEPLVQSAARMAGASRDMLREHPVTVAKNTLRYAYWMWMVPDSYYRFHPGGAPGVRTPTGDYVREAKADIYDVGTYETLLRPWMEPYGRYLRLDAHPTSTSIYWRAVAAWYYQHVEAGSSILGLCDSPYEAIGWLCFIGMIAALGTRNRAGWLLVSSVVFLQVLPSALFVGAVPRYAVPVKPLLLMFAALVICGFISTVRARLGSLRAVRRGYRFG